MATENIKEAYVQAVMEAERASCNPATDIFIQLRLTGIEVGLERALRVSGWTAEEIRRLREQILKEVEENSQ